MTEDCGTSSRRQLGKSRRSISPIHPKFLPRQIKKRSSTSRICRKGCSQLVHTPLKTGRRLLKSCREAQASCEQVVENYVENPDLARDPGPSFRQVGVIVHNRGGFSTAGLFMDSRTFVRVIPGITQTGIGKRHKLGFVCETASFRLGL